MENSKYGYVKYAIALHPLKDKALIEYIDRKQKDDYPFTFLFRKALKLFMSNDTDNQ